MHEQNHSKSLFQQLSTMGQQLGDKNVSLNERRSKIKAAETRIANEIRNFDSLTKEVQNLQASEAHKITELKRLNAEIDRLNTEVVEKKNTILDLQQTISTGSSDMEAVRLQKELDDEHEKHKRTVDSLNSSIRHGEALLEKEKEQRTKDLEFRKPKVKEMEDAHRQEVNDLENSYGASESRKLGFALEGAKAVNAELMANGKETWKKLLKKKEAEIEEGKKQIRAAKKTEYSLGVKIRYFNRTSNKKLEPMEEEVVDDLFEQPREEIEAELMEQVARIAELEKDNQQLQNDYDAIKAKYEDVEMDKAMEGEQEDQMMEGS
jgi:chromosome segregation ATPase